MEKRNKIKGIIFDLGGVLVENFSVAFLEKASKELKVRPDALRRAVQREEPRLQRGEETIVQFWHKVYEKLKVRCPSDRASFSLWVETYERHAKIKKDTIALIRLLQSKYKLAILSNTLEEHNKINRKRKLFDYFDVVLLSNEVGMRKPEKEFFALASKKLDIPLSNLLFVDDEIRWISAARKHGLQAILFKSADQLKEAFRKLGISVGKK
ncbi:MAG: HAD family phosphatase [Patescibacteria group bacterium]|nr:MAG: HAD family phosphatase [Patescibacteria group bacterium]